MPVASAKAGTHRDRLVASNAGRPEIYSLFYCRVKSLPPTFVIDIQLKSYIDVATGNACGSVSYSKHRL